jgi:hypothetical protein
MWWLHRRLLRTVWFWPVVEAILWEAAEHKLCLLLPRFEVIVFVRVVVGPSPSLGAGVVLARGNGHSLGGSGTQVVPPAPALAGTGGFAGGGGKSSFGAIDGAAVPPAPSVGRIVIHAGNGGGTGFGSLTGNGTQVVAPTPTMASSRVVGGAGGNGGTSLSNLGSQVLPPGSGSGEGSGLGSGSGKSGSASNGSLGSGLGAGGNASGAGSGTQTIAGLSGAPSGSGVGAQGGQASSPIISAAVPKHPEIPDIPAGKTEVLPLRVVQLALALPMSSYFSNYEAFVAERSVNRNTTQLIKLVYIFLPYQRRMTDFGVNTSKTFNLRVTRDPSCDESLISMTWPEGETPGQPAESDKDKLPCYRTTADDYRKAWEKAR